MPNGESPLRLDVFVASTKKINPNFLPNAPKDGLTWPPTSATLISGEHDAVLVDALFTRDEAEDLADFIAASGKNLTTIYITHGHSDHYFGMTTLLQRFPTAKGVALPSVANSIDPGGQSLSSVGRAKAMFGDQIPDSPARPEPMYTDRIITLEQDEVGGTVAKYPRQKLVMTSPVEFPMYGKFKKMELSKEHLLAFWDMVLNRADFNVRTGEKVEGIQKEADGLFTVVTANNRYRSHGVVLALGRTGTPRKLGVNLLFNSIPVEFKPNTVVLQIDDVQKEFPNDYVWIFAGGTPPFRYSKNTQRMLPQYVLNAYFSDKAKNQRIHG